MVGGPGTGLMPGSATTQWGFGNGSAGGTTTVHPSMTSGGGLLPGYQYGPNGTVIPSPTTGSTVSNYGSTTTPVSGPNGPFTALGAPLQTNANTLLNSGNSILNTAFDPQNQLYDQQFQKQRDQTNVNEAQRGITMSPYGAGVSNQADTNFNIGWQNNQLNRELQGIQGASQAMNPATTLYNGQYGSSTQGYSTQPPQQNSGGGGSGGQPQTQPSALPYPNMPTSSPYQSLVNFGDASQPTSQAPSQQPQYDPTTGQSYSYNPLLTDTSPSWQTIMNPAMQSPYMNPSTGTPFQNPADQPYVDPNTQGMSDYGGASIDQLMDPSNNFTNVFNDSGATSLLTNWSDPSLGDF